MAINGLNFLTSTYEGGWLLLFLNIFSSHEQCMVSVAEFVGAKAEQKS